MDLDKFLKSETFKTGFFVLFVIFVLLIVFKLGFLYGHKKTSFSHGYKASYHNVMEGRVWGHGGYKKGVVIKRMLGDDYSKYSKEDFIKIQAVHGSLTDDEGELNTDATEIIE